MRTTAVALLVNALVLALWLGLTAGPAAAIEQDPDVDTFAAYEYRADPEAGRVDVTITLDVTADKANRRTNNGVFQYYFEGYSMVIPADGEDLTITDDAGRALEYIVEEDFGNVMLISIDFRRNLFYRQTGTTIISFTYSGGTPRSSDTYRINDAYVGFPVWADQRLEGASFTVVAPEEFEDPDGGLVRFDRDVVDGHQRFTADIDNLEDFWVTVSLTDDSSMITTEVQAAGHQIELQAWPSDTGWADHVTDSLENGLPTLIDIVGLEWPIGDDLEIIESYSPYIHGYAGWYDVTTTQIEIGDELDEHLVYHELSHVWFNDDLFQDRWITEGLADAFAAEVIEAGGGDRPEPEKISLLDGEAQPLNAWSLSGLETPESESWAYGASWTVTEALVDEVGIEVLTSVVQASDAEELSYLGDGPPENFPRPKDWMYYLDLIENRSGTTDDEITDLFLDWAAQGIDRDRIEDRTAGRVTYAELVEAGGDWAPPLGVRRAMSGWQFNVATDLMAEAEDVLAARDELSDRTDALEVAIPVGLEATYERSADDFESARLELADATAAADRLVATDLARSEADGVLERIGAIGTDIDTDLVEAVEHFEAGLYLTATGESDRLDDEIEALRTTGLLRLTGAIAVLLVSVLTVRLVRRRRRNRAVDAQSSHTEDVHDDHPSAAEANADTAENGLAADRSPGERDDDSPPPASGEATDPGHEPGEPDQGIGSTPALE